MSNGRTQAVSDLHADQIAHQHTTHIVENEDGRENAYFKGVEYHIQFDCILTADRVVDLTCVCEWHEDHDGKGEENGAKNIGFLRRWKGGL